MNNRPVLEVTDLKVAYGGNVALDLPRIAVREKELVGVVGANGAGKSTLLRTLSGELEPDARRRSRHQDVHERPSERCRDS